MGNRCCEDLPVPMLTGNNLARQWAMVDVTTRSQAKAENGLTAVIRQQSDTAVRTVILISTEFEVGETSEDIVAVETVYLAETYISDSSCKMKILLVSSCIVL